LDYDGDQIISLDAEICNIVITYDLLITVADSVAKEENDAFASHEILEGVY